MTGTVTSIEAPGTWCLITDPTGTVYFAHKDDFFEPEMMVAGMDVEFRLKLIGAKGKQFPPVTEVRALQRKAA
jgi:hypothetical protein